MQSISGDALHDLIPAQQVEGTAVYALSGERLGHVDDLLLHKLSGKVAYAVLVQEGRAAAEPGRRVPLPWTMLKYDTGLGGYVASITASQLQTCPVFEDGEARNDDEAWGGRVHAFYQITPAWL